MNLRIVSGLMLGLVAQAADVLVMRDGREIVGTVVRSDEHVMVIQVFGHQVTFDQAQVARVKREDSISETQPS